MKNENPNSKTAKASRTRERAIEAAKTIFARDGYAHASLDEIVKDAQITTGAIYYHFSDKKGLFQSVAESLEQKILDEVTSNLLPSDDQWQSFEKAVITTLKICARPEIQRIVFRDAPAVIGQREWREIEVQYSFGLMHSTIEALATGGMIQSQDHDVTAQILLGAIIEAAHCVAEADGNARILASAKSTLRMILRSMKVQD